MLHLGLKVTVILESATHALEVLQSKGWIYDTMIPYVKSLTAAGKPIEFENKHWITIINEEDKK